MKAERRRDTKKLMKARMMIHKIQSNYEVDILPPIEKVLTAVKNGLTYGQLVKSLNLRPKKCTNKNNRSKKGVKNPEAGGPVKSRKRKRQDFTIHVKMMENIDSN